MIWHAKDGNEGVHGAAKHIGSTTFSYFQIFLAAAIIYLVVVNPLMSIFDVVAKRYALRQ